MNLTEQNYFGAAANQAYMSSTEFKRFMSCPARAVAIACGEWAEEVSTAMLVGSYVDAHFSGTLDLFKAQHPDIVKRDGSLKSEYEYANYIIARIERDEMFMSALNGDKQTILTGLIEGVPYKAKIDCLLPDRIVDLKVMASTDDVYVQGDGYKSFVTAWGYDIQGAIYRELVRQNTGKLLPFGLAVATKEKPEPNIDLINIPGTALNSAYQLVKAETPRFDRMKRGEEEPERCEACAYCRATKKLTEWRDLC